jgi:hypothetical protein
MGRLAAAIGSSIYANVVGTLTIIGTAVGVWLIWPRSTAAASGATPVPSSPYHAYWFVVSAIVGIVLTFPSWIGMFWKPQRPTLPHKNTHSRMLNVLLEKVWFAHNEGARYPLKLVVDLTNASLKPIHCLEGITWLAQRGDVGIQTNFGFGYWPYPKGSTHWVDNIPEPVIEPDERFHIWIGLERTCPDDDLNNRARAKRLGTLRLPIEIDGSEMTLEYRI